MFFGENVPTSRSSAALLVDEADALLVAGSSLTVMSGLRFVRAAHRRRRHPGRHRSGAAIASQLLTAGHQVTTLTGHPERAPAGTPLTVAPLDFTDPAALARALRGARTPSTTPTGSASPAGRSTMRPPSRNSRVLFAAAARAGVQRIVHASITHPSPASPYPYFRGKARVEQDLAECGVPYAVARPAILFGGDGVLINNIAWLLRHLQGFAAGRRRELPDPRHPRR